MYDKVAWYSDARLLAAAPEMLAELKRIEQESDWSRRAARVRVNICAAIFAWSLPEPRARGC
jgi:hypothetical protein